MIKMGKLEITEYWINYLTIRCPSFSANPKLIFSEDELIEEFNKKNPANFIIWDDMPYFLGLKKMPPEEDLAYLGWMFFVKWVF